MKPAVVSALLGLMAIGLTGCGSAMRDYLEKETPPQSAAIRQDLSMPPDLRLPPPGTTAPAPDPGAVAATTSTAALTAPPSEEASAAKTAAPAAPAAGSNTAADDVYTRAGISVYKADGTKKSDAELRRELQEYYLAQKKAKNPNYGTVFNIGNIFKDE
ncbi:hypothetical protein [Aestuariivirga sp.]|uniref:hypothetical protein n=1 Tax=Aestuariivirga sp. TaxID=2650926 RepID=UPI00391DB61B